MALYYERPTYALFEADQGTEVSPELAGLPYLGDPRQMVADILGRHTIAVLAEWISLGELVEPEVLLGAVQHPNAPMTLPSASWQLLAEAWLLWGGRGPRVT